MKLRKAYWVILTFLFLLFSGGKLRRMTYLATPNWVVGWRRISLGDRVRILPMSRIEVGKKGRLFLGSNISIGPNVNITCFGKLVIAENTTISANVFITDMDHDTSDPNKSVMDQDNLVSEITYIGKNCFIGTGAVILAGSYLDDGCIVGANAVVRGRFAKNTVLAGVPARKIKERL